MPLYFVSFRAILSPALVFFLLFCLCSRCRRITASPAPPRNYHPPRLVRPRVRHYCPECHSGLSATPPRPLRAQCGCSPCGACSGLFTCGAVSILSISRGCYPRFRPFPAILFGLCSFCRIVFYLKFIKMALLFASVIFFVYLCTRKLTLGCLRDITG